MECQGNTVPASAWDAPKISVLLYFWPDNWLKSLGQYVERSIGIYDLDYVKGK